MTTLLRIDASARVASEPGSTSEGSFSRDLADIVEARLVRQHADLGIVRRDLVTYPLPHIGDRTIRGYYTPDAAMTADLRAATALSDTLIAELAGADIVLISMPMYNFSIPSAFKAWVDHIVRIGKTFAYEDGNFRGLLADRKTYLCHSYGAGGYLDGGPLEGYDHMSPYVRMILNFIGISDITSFAVEATTADADTIAAKRRSTLGHIDLHFAA